MNEDKIDTIHDMIHMNRRLLFVMGYTTSAILAVQKYIPLDKQPSINWIIQAMENIVYLDKPLPPMPDN